MSLSKPVNPIRNVAMCLISLPKTPGAPARILFLRSTGRGKQWMFPGGMIDPGETPWRAMKREFKEEYGCDIPDLRDEGGKFESYDYHGHTRIYYGYTSQRLPAFDITKTKAPYEVSEAKWVKYDDVMKYDLKSYVRRSLSELMFNNIILMSDSLITATSN